MMGDKGHLRSLQVEPGRNIHDGSRYRYIRYYNIGESSTDEVVAATLDVVSDKYERRSHAESSMKDPQLVTPIRLCVGSLQHTYRTLHNGQSNTHILRLVITVGRLSALGRLFNFR